MECIFCKIIKKELPSEIVCQDENGLVFKDISPKAPLHLLIAPKEHIPSIVSDGSEKAVSHLVVLAKKAARQMAIESYKLVFNVGRGAGQTVDHLHMHLLASKGGQTLPSELRV